MRTIGKIIINIAIALLLYVVFEKGDGFKLLIESDFVDKVEKIYNGKLDLKKVDYNGRFSKVIVRCKVHNIKILTYPDNLLNGVEICKKCGYEKTRKY